MATVTSERDCCVCVGGCVCVGWWCGCDLLYYTWSIDNLRFSCMQHLTNLPCHQSLASTCGNEWAVRNEWADTIGSVH